MRMRGRPPRHIFYSDRVIGFSGFVPETQKGAKYKDSVLSAGWGARLGHREQLVHEDEGGPPTPLSALSMPLQVAATAPTPTSTRVSSVHSAAFCDAERATCAGTPPHLGHMRLGPRAYAFRDKGFTEP